MHCASPGAHTIVTSKVVVIFTGCLKRGNYGSFCSPNTFNNDFYNSTRLKRCLSWTRPSPLVQNDHLKPELSLCCCFARKQKLWQLLFIIIIIYYTHVNLCSVHYSESLDCCITPERASHSCSIYVFICILAVSICSALFIVFLLLSEFYSFISTEL